MLTIGAANSVASSASSDGQTVTNSVSRAALPCTITITLSATETVTVKASLARVSEKFPRLAPRK